MMDDSIALRVNRRVTMLEFTDRFPKVLPLHYHDWYELERWLTKQQAMRPGELIGPLSDAEYEQPNIIFKGIAWVLCRKHEMG